MTVRGASRRKLPESAGSAAVPWVVCAEHDRWPRAVRRFVPELMPPNCSIEVLDCSPADAGSVLSGHWRAVVLWQVIPSRLGLYCDLIAKASIATPQFLQLAATTELSPLEQAALSELGAAAIVRHPEDLMKLAKLMGVYFAP